MQDNLKALLHNGMNEISPDFCNEKMEQSMAALYDQISMFNPVYKLVAAEGEALVARHILDCMAPAVIISGLLGEHASVADLGSGSGLPGVVLATVLPQYDFTLVERMGRRAGFLRSTLALLGRSQDVSVVERDLSEVEGCFDAVVFRAFRPLKDILSDIAAITHVGSYVIAYKSSEDNIAEEISTAEAFGGFEVSVVPYIVPMLDAKRSLLVLKRVSL